jgi:glycosyltransferase involved in cell wall biosynthesis
MASPTVSVVIPVYNAERYLADTLRSVFAQTFQDYEVICVNDGSIDDSVAILEQFSDKVRVIHQRNSGLGLSLILWTPE